MYTRKQQMNGDVSHHEYFSQFVDERIRLVVQNHIGWDKIINSTDQHFNDIPLKYWDALVPGIQHMCFFKLKETGEGNSIASCVCVAKAAARMIKDEHLNKTKAPNFTDEL